MTRTKPYPHTSSHIKRLRSKKNQAFLVINAMIQAFDNEDYESAYAQQREAQKSLANFWADFNMFRGWQENGIKEEVWLK